MIRVLLVDDDDLVRAGMSMIIESTDDISVVGEASGGREAVSEAARLGPDVVLMDIQMPDGDGIEATRKIVAAAGDEIRVIVVTTFEQDRYVFEALRAGASGYLLKRSRPEDLLNGIRLVAGGEGLLSPSITRRLIEEFADLPSVAADPESVADLTDREHEVLLCVARGLSNSEIGAEMHISESTAKTHLKRVLMKLGLRDRVAAVVFAYESGLLRPGS